MAALTRENERLRQRVAELERQVAEQDSLASLYVAAYQLHTTTDLHEVLQIVVEILINLVGAKTFAILLYDEEKRRFRPVAVEGTRRAQVPELGEAMHRPMYGHPSAGMKPGSHDPAICIPLRIKDQVVGMIEIWELLRQKSDLADVDIEIFNLLGTHAASALEAARLRAEAKGARHGFEIFDVIGEA